MHFTRLRTGLRVYCALNPNFYPTKIKVLNEQMDSLDLFKHTFSPEWNYTLFPRGRISFFEQRK